MRKNVFFPQSVMTDTKYYKSGVMITTPAYAHPNLLVENAPNVKQQGTLTVDQDGVTIFTPFNRKDVRRYLTMCQTTNGELKEYPSRLSFRLSVNKDRVKKHPEAYANALRCEFETMLRVMLYNLTMEED